MGENVKHNYPVSRGSVEAIARDDGDDLFERIAAGETMAAVAAAYGLKRGAVYNWIKAEPDRERRWREAKQRSADALIEEAKQIVDDPDATQSSAHAAMAKERASFRRWLASKRSGEYADSPVVGFNLNVGHLFLEALQQRGSMSALQQREPIAVTELMSAEVVDEVDP